MINEDVAKAQRKIVKWTKALKDLQDACPHEGAVKVPKASTGNYDPDCNSYWYEIDCPSCGKHYTEPQ
jgi:hypothetical protein